VTRVTWDASGERLFHTGVDRGMVYLDDGTVSTWNGLVSVTESPSGGTPTPTYLDGQKILNVPGGEDYVATLEAMSLPVVAAACAGWGILQYGLYAGSQPKETFGFSYRTLIGNDVEGTNFAYKIHIVYGCLAKSSDFAHETSSDQPSVKPYSWVITAVPVSFGSRTRPSAHVIFDTRIQSSPTITAVEALLYGSVDNDPVLPTTDQIALLLSS
jgi:hypothetical protein